MHRLYSLINWRMGHRETHLMALLVSGSLLMGSSIAYPMLSQDGSGWAPVALEIFLLSAVCFNVFNILEILLYGLYTLIVGVVGMLLVLLWGTDTLTEYCRLIPVYTTAASFLTVAWPSLLESIGHQSRTVQDLLHPTASLCLITPLSGISVDTDPSNYAVPGSSHHTGWLHSPMRQTDSPAPLPLPQSSSGGITQEAEPGRLLSGLISHDISARGPSYSGSPHRADTVTSISLSSRASWPSEMSSIVRPFFGPIDADRVPRETSRRHDINALGRLPVEPADFFSSHPLMPMPRSTASV